MPRGTALGAILLGLVLVAESAAQPRSSDAASDAYFHFLLGRHHETEGETEQALEAHREAARLDPSSAEIQAEIAGFYARHGRTQEALAAARAALALDENNREANRILGRLLAMAAEADSPPEPLVEEAILRLERGRGRDGIDVDPAIELGLARLYTRAGRLDEATRLLHALVEREPMPEAWLLLAQAHTAGGRIDEAVRALEEGAALHPRLLMALADLLERHQRWPEAASAYERAVAEHPHIADIKVRWAGALLNVAGEASASRARTILEEVTRAEPGDERALYLLSQAQRRSRDFAAAEATARRVVALDPGGLWGPYALAQVHEDRHDYRGVVNALRDVVAAWQPSGESPARHGLALLMRLGFAHMQLGEHEAAIDVFERARSLPGADSSFDLYLAQAYLGGRRFEEARRTVEPLAASNPDDLRLSQITARAVHGLGQTDEAVALLERAVASSPSEPAGYVSLAALLADAERYDEAVGVLEDADRRFPGNVSVLFQRGTTFERAQDPARAEEAFRAVLAADPSHAGALNYLGYMLADRGERLDEAVELIERALADDPENASYLDSLGWAYFRQRRIERALDYLGRAAEKLPSNSVVQDHYGDALAAAGRHGEAIAAWERALAGDRDDVDVGTIEQKLQRARERVSR